MGEEIKIAGWCHVRFSPPLKNHPYQRGAIFSRPPSRKTSPPGDLFMITVCEKINPPLFGSEKFVLMTKIFLTGAIFSLGE